MRLLSGYLRQLLPVAYFLKFLLIFFMLITIWWDIFHGRQSFFFIFIFSIIQALSHRPTASAIEDVSLLSAYVSWEHSAFVLVGPKKLILIILQSIFLKSMLHCSAYICFHLFVVFTKAFKTNFSPQYRAGNTHEVSLKLHPYGPVFFYPSFFPM